MADNPTRPDTPPPPPPKPHEPVLKPSPELQQRLDNFSAQKAAKQDAGEVADHRVEKARNAELKAARQDGNAAPHQRAEAAAARQAAMASSVRDGSWAARGYPRDELRPSPAFQKGLDDFTAKKDAKRDSGAIEDHRAKRSENQEVNAAARAERMEARKAENAQARAQQTEGPRTPHQRAEDTAARQAAMAGNRATPRPANSEQTTQRQSPLDQTGQPKSPVDQRERLQRQPEANKVAKDVQPRPGDDNFDPGEHKGELRNGFRPGCQDPHGRFSEKETRVAERLAEDGAAVHPRERDDTTDGHKNPDAMVRTSADDPGRITEFKTLESASSSSVRRNILEAGQQVGYHGGGDAVIDGRDVDLTEDAARRGYNRAAGQAREHGQPMPERVSFILGDGSIKVFPEETTRV